MRENNFFSQNYFLVLMLFFFLETHGCSMSKNESEMVKGYLEQQGLIEVNSVKKADFVLINACGVKEVTENRMIKRIRELNVLKKKNAKLIVFGCLPRINPERIKKIDSSIFLAGPSLKEVSELVNVPELEFAPLVPVKKFNKFISIISISNGCLSNCTYCATINARGRLKSYSIQEIKKKFEKELKTGVREFWLTSQDTGCYGFDLGVTIVDLLKELLLVEGDFRIRVGMMNPIHLKKFVNDYLDLFNDERLFKFIHLPVQSGSNKILKAMNRGYSRQDFLKLVKKIRRAQPLVTISTDVIVGFPGESEKDFLETISVLEESKPEIVNISRYGVRPNTIAAKMPNQIHGRVKKQRSRVLTKLCEKYSLNANKKLVGSVQTILVSETGRKNNFIGRTSNYRPVAVKKDVRNHFVSVKIISAKKSFVSGVIEKVF